MGREDQGEVYEKEGQKKEYFGDTTQELTRVKGASKDGKLQLNEVSI